MELTHDSPMPWGKYKGALMSHIPKQYLLFLYRNNKAHTELKKYIEDYLIKKK